MRIVFVHNGLAIDGGSLARGPLGGTETALIHTARALAANPENEVHVFGRTGAPGPYAGVEYHELVTLGPWASGHDVDVLIAIREWLVFLLPIRARLRIYFSPDAHDQPCLHAALSVPATIDGEELRLPLLPPHHFLSDVDAIFCVGKWQADTFASCLDFPRGKLHITRNGVDLALFSPRPLLARKKRLVYSSTPFRGLCHLLSFWPALRAECPGLGLDVCSSMAVYGVPHAEDQERYGALYEAMDALPGVRSLRSLRQAKLAELLCQDLVFAYPSTFPETYCIAVAEAQAAGLPVVTSAHSALRERVEDGVDGILIEGQPDVRDPGYGHAFVEAVRHLVTDRALWQRMSDAARKKASRLGYGPLAREWEAFFDDAIGRRPVATRPEAAALRLSRLDVPHPTKVGLQVSVTGEQLRQVLAGAAAGFGFHLDPRPEAP